MSVSPAVNASGLEFESKGGIVRITLNRPEKRNALSHSLLAELGEAFRRVAAEGSARVVILGARGKAFSAGHDLSEMIGRRGAQYDELFSLCSSVMQTIRQLPQPVIARVQGPAFAAGCQLVAACDLAVAVDTATFATPGVKIGLFCTTPMVPLVRAIPAKPAMEMLLTGAPISAQRAYEVGLVNRVVPEDALDEAVQSLADAILASSPAVIRLGKAAFYDQLALTESEAYSRATDVMTRNAQQPDAQEGMTAFLEKRPANWSER